jgi:bacterioferritin-associated ferredoxin
MACETPPPEKMIVCSCNVLSDNDVRACLNPGPGCPRTPAQVYQCLGCSPDCGRCARTLRSIISDALGAAEAGGGCERGCCSTSHMVEALAAAAEA